MTTTLPTHPTTAGPCAPARTVIGVDVGGTKIDIALADENARILQRQRLETRPHLGPDQAITRIARAVSGMSRLAATQYGTQVSGWAAVAPGVIRSDRILLTPNLPGWEDLALAARLSEEFAAPVQVANDVRAGALAEVRLGALREVGTGIYVSLGTGIAGALVVDGRVLPGAHEAAGEMGYMNPGLAPLDAVGAGRAPLEEAVGGRALTHQAHTALGVALETDDLFRSTDPAAQAITEHALDALASALANLCVFLDPERIALGGGVMSAADVIIPALSDRIGRATAFPPQIRAARFRQDASLRGALQLALTPMASAAGTAATHDRAPAAGVAHPTPPGDRQ